MIIWLTGQPGSGKTTLLRIIAGLEKPKNGELYLKKKLVSGGNIFIPPEQRKIGFVFQDYALFPHLTVKENVLIALSKNEKSKADKVLKMLDINQLSNLLQLFNCLNFLYLNVYLPLIVLKNLF